MGDHEHSAKSTIGFVIGFVYRFQCYKSKFFLVFFYVFRFAVKINKDYKILSLISSAFTTVTSRLKLEQKEKEI